MIEINKKYGCLTVLDNGEEYPKTEVYLALSNERSVLIEQVRRYISVSDEQEKKQIILKDYPSSSFAMDLSKDPERINEIFDSFISHRKYFNGQRIKRIDEQLIVRYKCQCRCGKLHYFSEETIETKPKYCFYPVPISTKYSYSNRARNATYRKEQQYEKSVIDRHVVLLDRTQCVPSDDYCENWNKYKIKQISKKEKIINEELAKLPRVYAKNYDENYAAKQYESLLIEECVNDHLESKPSFTFTQFHHKRWHSIIVYKQYRCRCLLCGREQLITCDKFGIFPPTEYGYRACNGYWSDVSCDCHPISSFQWIVTRLLMESGTSYQVEYSFDDLYGVAGKNKLRFDFAVFNSDGTIKALIECQGEQHYKPVEEFGGLYAYETQKKNDQLKREYAEKNNIRVVEISYKDKHYERVKEILTVKGIIA